MQDISYLSDHELLSLVKKNSEWAINELDYRYRPRILRLCKQYLNNVTDAEDVTQSVFVTLFVKKKILTFRGDCKLWVWIYRIVVNACKMAIRKKAIYQQRLMVLEKNNPIIERTQENQVCLQKCLVEHTNKRLADAFRELSLKDKKIIIATYFLNKTYKDTAALMNITVSTTGVRLLRAKKKLARLYRQKSKYSMLMFLNEFFYQCECSY